MKHFSFWLLPNRSGSKKWNDLIQELSNLYVGPKFQSHVTIYSGTFQNSRLKFKKFLDELETIVLYPSGLIFEEKFTKSCYIQFQKNNVLEQWFKKIKEIFEDERQYELNPHMSLFYGKLTQEQKNAITSRVKLPSSIEFNEFRVMDTGLTQTSADVQAWKRLI